MGSRLKGVGRWQRRSENFYIRFVWINRGLAWMSSLRRGYGLASDLTPAYAVATPKAFASRRGGRQRSVINLSE